MTPRLERLDRGREEPRPLAECREFIEALRTRVGVAARESLPEGLREGARAEGEVEGEAWLGAFKGVRGVEGDGERPGDRGPRWPSDSWLSDCDRPAPSSLELEPEPELELVLLEVAAAAARRGGSALGGDAIWATYKTGSIDGLQQGDMRKVRRGEDARNTPRKPVRVCERERLSAWPGRYLSAAPALRLALCLCLCLSVCAYSEDVAIVVVEFVYASADASASVSWCVCGEHERSMQPAIRYGMPAAALRPDALRCSAMAG
jgi:hypothetical protein